MRKIAYSFLCAAAASLAVPAIAGDDDTASVATKEITDKRHPDYVKCRSQSVIGSRAKKRRVCMTNREWAEAARKGNAMANTVVESGRAGIRLPGG